MLKILALITFSMEVFLGYEAIKAKFLIPFNVLIFLFIYINYRFSNFNSVLIFLLSLILYTCIVINHNHYSRVQHCR